MPRVVPSQVVQLIDQLFPDAQRQTESQEFGLRMGNIYQVAALLDLVQEIPSELIVLSPDRYAELVSSIAAIRTVMQSWQSHGDFAFNRVPGLRRLNPVTLIRQALVACPDEFPSPGTTELAFITDNALRDNLRKDISATNRALTNGDWKAATVLAGSVVEALIFWALQQRQPDNIQTAIQNLLGTKLSRNPDNNLENWVLFEYIEVAAELKVISDETATQARLAKDFRNLIHPGRAARLGQECNRGTALSAVAALEHVVNDLTS